MVSGSPRRGFAALAGAVAATHRRVLRHDDPVQRLRAFSELLRELQRHTVAVTAERDAELKRLLRRKNAPSHRELAEAVGVSRQRIDQLAAIAASGGRRRPRRPG